MIPKTWFSTPLSKSAKDTEGRIRNIFEGQRRRPAVFVLALVAAVALLCGSVIALREKTAPAVKAESVTGAYASVEDYIDAVRAKLTSVTYYAADSGEEQSANVLDTRVALLQKRGEASDLAPDGTLELYRYQIETQIDVLLADVALAGGMYEAEDGWCDLEGQGGHALIVLRRIDGSVDVLRDAPCNDDMGGIWHYQDSENEALYDWAVQYYNLDLPLYSVELSLGGENKVPANREHGDGWYLYVPVRTWWYREDEGNTARWYSRYNTGSTISIREASREELAAERPQLADGQAERFVEAPDGRIWCIWTQYDPSMLIRSDMTGLEPAVLDAMAESFTAVGVSEKRGDSLRFPEEASTTAFSIPNGADGAWGWSFGSIAEEQIPALFGQSGALRFEGAQIDGLSTLSADGIFDENGIAQRMTVQGWSAVNGDKPIFWIDLYRLDSKLLGNTYPPPEHVEENTVRGTVVQTCWEEKNYGTNYHALFETQGLGVRCMTTATESRTAEQARELLARIVFHCLSENGVRLPEEPYRGSLTEEELDAWREELCYETSYIDEELGVNTVRASLVSCFFTSYYSDPCDLDLGSFLDYCPLGRIIGFADGSMTEAEHAAIVDALGGADPTRAVPTRRYLVSDINAALEEYAGITLDDLTTDWRNDERMLYLPEYDAFYNFTSDWGPGRFEPISGERAGNYVTLRSEHAVLTLWTYDGGFYILSHERAENARTIAKTTERSAPDMPTGPDDSM